MPSLLGAVEHLHPRRARRPADRRSRLCRRGAVVDDEHAEALARRARERLTGGAHDRLDVLGLVVGGQYEPGGAVH